MARKAHQRFLGSPTSTNFNDLAMECFQAVNFSISLMERTAQEKQLGMATSYGELVELLEKDSFLTSQQGKKLRRLVRLRNLISHEYFNINRQELLEMYKLLGAVRSLFTRI